MDFDKFGKNKKRYIPSNYFLNNKINVNNQNKKNYSLVLITVCLLLIIFIMIFFFNKYNRNNIKIVIKDKESGLIVLSVNKNQENILDYNWNNEGFSNKDTYTITSPGSYTLVVRYKDSKKSSVMKVEISDSDFMHNDVSNSEVNDNNNTNDVNDNITNDKHDSSDVNDNNTGNNKNENINIEKNDNINYNEHNKDKIFTLTINANGASVTNNEVKCTSTTDSCSVTLPNIIRDGWSIIGFNEKNTDTSAMYKVNQQITINKDTTLYAITSKKVTATFKTNGATSISKTSASCYIYNNNAGCNVSFPTVTRAGWSIVGFDEKSTNNTAAYKANQPISINKNVTLHAITEKKVTATFSANGATSLSKTSEVCSIYNTNTSCRITFPKIIRDGWVIIGFNKTNTAQTATYSENQNVNISRDTNFYAITSKKINVNFYTNGATSLSHISDSCTVYNTTDACDIKFPAIVRENAEILGFALIHNSQEGLIKANQTVKLSTNLDFYAITRKKITVTFDSADVNYIEKQSDSCYIYNTSNSCKITMPYVEKKGYLILGFNDEKNKIVEKAQYARGIAYDFDKNKTLYISYNQNMKYYRNISVSQYQKYGKVYFEKDAKCNTSFDYKGIVSNFYSNWPFVFNNINSKITILERTRYYNMYGGTGGLTFYPIRHFTGIDMACNVNALILLHEISHMYDKYIGDITGARLSSNSDFLKLYNKYKANKETADWNDDYGSEKEFFATTMGAYYQFYFYGDTANQKNFQCDLKSFIENKVVIPNGISVPKNSTCKS